MIKLAQGKIPSEMIITWSSEEIALQGVSFYGLSTTDVQHHLKLNICELGICVNVSSPESISQYSFQSYVCKSGELLPLGSTYMGQGYYTSSYFHHLTLRNLTPATVYYYAVGDIKRGDMSVIHSFATLPPLGSNIMANGQFQSIAIFSDSGVSAKVPLMNTDQFLQSEMPETISNILRNSNISMVLHPGDMAYADGNAALWDFYDIQNEILTSKLPMHYSAGNHEQESSVGDVDRQNGDQPFVFQGIVIIKCI